MQEQRKYSGGSVSSTLRPSEKSPRNMPTLRDREMKGLPFSIQELFCVEDSDSTGQFFTSETEVTLYYRKLCIIEGSQTSLLKA